MRRSNTGFTLIGVLLALVVMGMVFLIISRYIQTSTQQAKLDKAAVELQQILNASLVYYNTNSSWPDSVECLQGVAPCTAMYLPPDLVNPWGQPYNIASTPDNPIYAYTAVITGSAKYAKAYASTISGVLPNGYISNDAGTPPPINVDCSTTTCFVVTSIDTPAPASGGPAPEVAGKLKFAGIFHNNACVPVPTCPADTTPEIFVTVSQIMGIQTAGGGVGSAAPITDFSTYAVGPVDNNISFGCPTVAASDLTNCASTEAGTTLADQYWKVCINIGVQSSVAPSWAAYQTAMAVTRCSPNSESQGSAFTVYQ